jgi:hypothetical protein
MFYNELFFYCCARWGYIVAFTKFLISQAPVAQACNPNYSGGRDQKNCGLNPAWTNTSARPYLEKTLHKKELVVGLTKWLKQYSA